MAWHCDESSDVGLTESMGANGGGGVQLQDTVTLLLDPCPEKVRFALAGHFCWGIVIVTGIDSPAATVPLDGLMVMPLMPLLKEVQASLLCEPAAGEMYTVHVVQSVKLVGLAVSTATGDGGGVQLHSTGTSLAAPLKSRYALAGQLTFGTDTVTGIDWPASSVPDAGLNVMPDSPALAVDQLTLLCEPEAAFAAVSITVQLRQPLVKPPGVAEMVRALPLEGVTLTVTPMI